MIEKVVDIEERALDTTPLPDRSVQSGDPFTLDHDGTIPASPSGNTIARP